MRASRAKRPLFCFPHPYFTTFLCVVNESCSYLTIFRSTASASSPLSVRQSSSKYKLSFTFMQCLGVISDRMVSRYSSSIWYFDILLFLAAHLMESTNDGSMKGSLLTPLRSMYEELKELGVTFVSKNEQFDTSSAIGEAISL